MAGERWVEWSSYGERGRNGASGGQHWRRGQGAYRPRGAVKAPPYERGPEPNTEAAINRDLPAGLTFNKRAGKGFKAGMTLLY